MIIHIAGFICQARSMRATVSSVQVIFLLQTERMVKCLQQLSLPTISHRRIFLITWNVFLGILNISRITTRSILTQYKMPIPVLVSRNCVMTWSKVDCTFVDVSQNGSITIRMFAWLLPLRSARSLIKKCKRK